MVLGACLVATPSYRRRRILHLSFLSPLFPASRNPGASSPNGLQSTKSAIRRTQHSPLSGTQSPSPLSLYRWSYDRSAVYTVQHHLGRLVLRRISSHLLRCSIDIRVLDQPLNGFLFPPTSKLAVSLDARVALMMRHHSIKVNNVNSL